MKNFLKNHNFEWAEFAYLPIIMPVGIFAAMLPMFATMVVLIPIMSVIGSVLLGDAGWNQLVIRLDTPWFPAAIWAAYYITMIGWFILQCFERKRLAR